jgi:hypothetical protein
MDDAKSKLEQDIILAADCWARGVLQKDSLLDLTEQNLLDAILVYDKFIKRNRLDPSHLPPPPPVPYDMDDTSDQIPTVRYSEYETVRSPSQEFTVVISEPAPSSDDIF